MSFKPVNSDVRLSFEDYPGLEVVVSSCTFGELEELTLLDPNDPSNTPLLLEKFADKLIYWSMLHPAVSGSAEACPKCGLHEDEIMPPTVPSLKCIDVRIVLSIIVGWVTGISRVSIPKDVSLNNGGKNGPEMLPRHGMPQTEIMEKLAALQNPLT